MTSTFHDLLIVTVRMRTPETAIRLIAREGLCSVSSNTKWHRVLDAVSGIPCRKRVKWIDVEEPSRWEVGLWRPHGNFVECGGGLDQMKFIEWIEVECVEVQEQGRLVSPRRVDRKEEIAAALREQRARFEEAGDAIRVLGYLRPERPPK
ncbi:DUF6678 family protein [Luteolibacter flavescens]|uniref:DUF6678 family protein n=1 Tax=Luteolibacter flavescens TaxID=1859460 RepID=UPI003CCCE29B